jgi:hypothetical protein
MTTGLMTTVNNTATQKKYFVSTVDEPRVGGWQTAVFREIFGPIANFSKPAFFLGGSAPERAADQHQRVEAISETLIRRIRKKQAECCLWN